jgi:hypothetical protein
MINEVHTSTQLPVPLFPVDKLYQTGNWDFLLRDDKRGGPVFIKYDNANQPTNSIPLEYDYENKCTWITYGVGGKGGEKIKQKQTKRGEGQLYKLTTVRQLLTTTRGNIYRIFSIGRR